MRKCEISNVCGGCSYIEKKYDESIDIKQSELNLAFSKIAKLDIIKAEHPYNYRHKVVASATTINNKLRFGLYQENTKQVIPFSKCLIQPKDINEIICYLEEIFNKYKIKAYNIDTNQGIIKHVLFRKSFTNGEIILVIVTNGSLLPNNKLIVKDIVTKFSNVKTIVQNIHNKKTKLILLDDEKLLYGNGFIYDEIDGLKFKISAKSFYQVNPEQAIKLYNKALDIARVSENQRVVDCYSGIGTISLLAAKRAKSVVAIESNKSAHNDALMNKKLNNINNVEFICSDVIESKKILKQSIDLLIMDPTRDGASKEFLDFVLDIKPKKILYISCFYKTQIRDLEYLRKIYVYKEGFAVDMFPWTSHVETVVLLELKH